MIAKDVLECFLKVVGWVIMRKLSWPVRWMPDGCSPTSLRCNLSRHVLGVGENIRKLFCLVDGFRWTQLFESLDELVLLQFSRPTLIVRPDRETPLPRADEVRVILVDAQVEDRR